MAKIDAPFPVSLLMPSTQTLDNHFYIVDAVDTFSCVGARARGQRIDNLKKVIENTLFHLLVAD